MNLPTPETYDELQRAYDFFNEKLFSNELPPCLITLQREKRTYGYCSFKRFAGR
ncbi:sprT domain-containing protein, partial [Klebsiella michiganensis]|nr:sprT domain-containing protein [Klebsiella michiganensis]